MNLVRAFLLLREQRLEWRRRLRLVMVGDGSLYPQVCAALSDACAEGVAWIPGARNDVAEILRALDVFVLPSHSEGMSNTLLEAMATGLPAVATRVGGNPELVVEGATGVLVPRSDPQALAEALDGYARSAEIRMKHGRAARARVEHEFSLDRMVLRYLDVYDNVLRERRVRSVIDESSYTGGN